MNLSRAYETEFVEQKENIRFLFESIGYRSIIKVIEYTPLFIHEGRLVYNLGFGDFDEKTGTVCDYVNSNNGDMRVVFSTVLDTIPRFFEHQPDAAIWIQGSDSADHFKRQCQKTCRKNCSDRCKNFNRRLKIYQYYLDRHFETLGALYHFHGHSSSRSPLFTPYLPGDTPSGLLLFQKKKTNFVKDTRV